VQFKLQILQLLLLLSPSQEEVRALLDGNGKGLKEGIKEVAQVVS
jgi:hypothetical protein